MSNLPDTLPQVLRQCQGARSGREFAAWLGVAPSTLCMIYSGDRKVGRTILTKLMDALPDMAERVLWLFFAQ